MRSAVKVFAPATIANLNCGFDILGLAIDEPGDIIEAKFTDNSGITIEEITGDGGKLPREVEKNTAGMAVKSLLDEVGAKKGVSLRIEKHMPLGSGLGSSAASAVAAVVAVNELVNSKLSANELLPFAMEGEKVASGSYHADNVAPSLLGGAVLISSYDPLTVIQIPVPAALWVCVVHPEVEIKTMEARAMLPDQIDIKKAVKQAGNAAGFISGMYSDNFELISRSLKDEIVEEHRSKLIPGFPELRKKAMQFGALGFGISGSGPSVFALCKGETVTRKVAHELRKIFSGLNILSKDYVSKVNGQGPRILE